MSLPWQYTTFLELLDHWQALIAGALGFAAAITTVVIALGSEGRKRKHELSIIRRALGIEVRQYMANAYRGYLACRGMLEAGAVSVHALAVEDKAKLPAPTIYLSVAARIGEFSECGEQLVLFYSRIAVAREAAERLLRHPMSESLPHSEIAEAATALIRIAETGLKLVPFLTTDIESLEKTDLDAIGAIEPAFRDWEKSHSSFGSTAV
jgi:hypothetical protein